MILEISNFHDENLIIKGYHTCMSYTHNIKSMMDTSLEIKNLTNKGYHNINSQNEKHGGNLESHC